MCALGDLLDPKELIKLKKKTNAKFRISGESFPGIGVDFLEK